MRPATLEYLWVETMAATKMRRSAQLLLLVLIVGLLAGEALACNGHVPICTIRGPGGHYGIGRVCASHDAVIFLGPIEPVVPLSLGKLGVVAVTALSVLIVLSVVFARVWRKDWKVPA